VNCPDRYEPVRRMLLAQESSGWAQMKSMIAHRGHEGLKGKEVSDFGLSSQPSCTLCEHLSQKWLYEASDKSYQWKGIIDN